MPEYRFKCPTCDEHRKVFRPMKDCRLPEVCVCGKLMERDFHAECHSVRGDYKKPIVSTSLAFDTQDLTEHRKQFHDVEVRVEGRMAEPILKSLSQKRKYLKARGWKDVNDFV